jgi:hypothetical protein
MDNMLRIEKSCTIRSQHVLVIPEETPLKDEQASAKSKIGCAFQFSEKQAKKRQDLSFFQHARIIGQR